MKLRSQYSTKMAEESAEVLAAQVVNYLKGEDIAAVMEAAAEPLKSEIGRIRGELPGSAARAMAESGSTREVIVATLRMKALLEFMTHGESYFRTDLHQRIHGLLSTYGPEFPEEINPAKYSAMAHRYYQEHLEPRRQDGGDQDGNDIG
jgi:hypothetical protein